METLQYLIKNTFRYAIVFFVAAFAWWLLALIFPNLSLQSLITAVGGKPATTTIQVKDDWLPAPGSLGSLFGRKAEVPTATSNLYVPGPAYSGNAYNDGRGGANVTYTTYTTSSGKSGSTFDYAPYTYTTTTPTTTTQPVQQPLTNKDTRRLYVRNLSIFEGGSIYTNIAFTGEARNTMFKDGKFPIILVDNTGRGGVIAIAVATSDWTIPGWTRFQTKITANLPIKVPCTLIFQGANGTATQKPIQISFPIRCN